MATINYYPDGPQGDVIIEDVECLARWLVDEANSFDKLYVWEDQIAKETAVTDPTDEQLLDVGATFHVSAIPAGPETWIPLIISVVIGVAAAVLFTPEIPNIADPVNNLSSSSNNALQGRSNSSRLGQRLPDVRGTDPQAFPDLWMTYNRFENNVEVEISYLCVSVGRLAIPANSVNDGDTLLSQITGGSAAFYGPNSSPAHPTNNTPFLQIGDPITDPLYLVEQFNEVNGNTLLAPNSGALEGPYSATINSTADTATIQSHNNNIALDSQILVGDLISIPDFTVLIQDVAGGDIYTGGDVGRFIGGTKLVHYRVLAVTESAVTIDIRGPFDNQGPFDLARAWYRDGGARAGVAPLSAWRANDGSNSWSLNFRTGYQDEQDFLRQLSPVDQRIIGPFNVTGRTNLWVNLVAPSGLYHRSTSIIPISIEFTVTFTGQFDLSIETQTITLRSNITDQVQRTFELVNPFGNDRESTMSIVRVTPTDLNFNGTVVDEVKWRDLYAVEPLENGDFGNVTTILARTMATTSALRVKNRELSCRPTRFITRPDGTEIASDEFADVVFSLHTDPLIGRRTAATIDHVGLYAVQEQVATYFGNRESIRVGYTFDDDSLRYEDHLNLILTAVNCTAYQVGSQIKFWFISPQAVSVQQFGHRSKVPSSSNGEERRTRRMLPSSNYDGVELVYKSLETGDKETIYVPTDRSATNPEVIELNGCIIERNAIVTARRYRNQQLHSRIAHEFSALEKGRLLAKGQRIDVVDNTRNDSISGYVTRVDGLRYYLSQPFTIPATGASIVLTRRDGSLEGIDVTPGPNNEYVVLAMAPSEAVNLDPLEDFTEYSLATDNMRTNMAMLVTSIEPSGLDDIRVTCSNYTDAYYSGDLTP